MDLLCWSEMHPRVLALLEKAAQPDPPIRPTEIYNEGWMLNLLLDWAQDHASLDHAFHFLDDARWYAEALLPTTFKARYRGDPLSESWTNADGALGHFEIGMRAKGDLTLRKDCSQFVVIEAKMSSGLSTGTKNAPGFDQAARNVACIAEVLQRANRHPSKLERLGLIVTAPQKNIDQGKIGVLMARDHILEHVHRRVLAYDGEKEAWFRDWFLPTLDHIHLQVLSWESLVDRLDPSYQRFYEGCLLYN